MKNILLIILTALLVAAFQYFLPWYTLAVPTFAIGFLGAKRKPFAAFLVGFFAVFFLWAIMISMISFQNNFILAKRISQLFFKHEWVWLLVVVNSLIGAIVGGISALSGRYLRDAM